jgi:hypothetical protein
MAIYYRIEETVGSYYIVWDNIFTTYTDAQNYIRAMYPNMIHLLRVAEYSSNGWKPVRIR